MASIITVCHTKLNPAQVHDCLGIFNERLQNELTRDASLKALARIALNSDAKDRKLI